MKLKKITVFFVTMLTLKVAYAENVTIEVNVDTIHSTGGVRNFSRKKFIQWHGSLTKQEWENLQQERNNFFEEHDIYTGRSTGSVSYVLNQVKENPNFDGYVDPEDLPYYAENFKNNFDAWSYENAYRDKLQIVGLQKKRFPGQVLNGWSMGLNNYDALGRYYQHYLTQFFGDGGASGPSKPAFLEVINEPLFMLNPDHADYIPGLTRTDIWNAHKKVAKIIHSTHPNVKVGGYTVAEPRPFLREFEDWEENQKAFMDIAGEDMDFFSLHLYDTTGKPGRAEDKLLRGGQIEANLDIIEAYTHIKRKENPHVAGWKTEKPFLISEYGTLGQDHVFSSQLEADWENMAAFNAILVQLLERPNKILSAVPFILHRDQTRLLNDDNTFTRKIDFYKLWRKVNGTRSDTKSSDPDLQVDAYVQGNKAYVIINNLEDQTRTVDLNINGGVVKSLQMRRLYSNVNNEPIYQEDIPLNPETTQNIPAFGTTVFEYEFTKKVSMSKVSSEAKYYANTYLQAIDVASTNMTFFVNNVKKSTAHGEAIIRLGVNRPKGKTVIPSHVFINGEQLTLPTDWKGDSQPNFYSFFGMLEIAVPWSKLNKNGKTTNNIQVRFSETGGFVSSVALQVFERSHL